MEHAHRLLTRTNVRHILSVLLALYISVSSSGCVSASDKTQVDPSAKPFPFFDADFSRYRFSALDWLEQHSMPHRTKQDIELNLPFEISANANVPYQGRFLLFHGLNDSPYVWRNMATELGNRGFDVRAILFAGHGSTPKEMLEVEWESWLSSGRDHLQAWQTDGIPIHLGGFSMGAVIATWLALDNPQIASLLLISPAFESQLNHYLRWSGVYGRYRPWVFGGMILEDNPIKYNSIPVNSGWQYFQLARGLKRRWSWGDRIDIPALLVLSEDDSVVNHHYTRRLFRKRFVSDRRLLITYSASDKGHAADSLVRAAHSATGEEAVPALYPFEESRVSAFPEKRILNQSHLGLMYSPDNPLFGKNASVLVCNGNEYPVFITCMRARDHWYGAQHTPSPDSIPVARTTYNSDWQGVLTRLDNLLLLAGDKSVPKASARRSPTDK